jgi:transglycosylase
MIKLKKLFVIFLSAVIVSLPTLSMADETPVQNLVAGQSDIAESNEDLGGKKNDMFEFGGDSQIDSMDSAIAAMLTDVVEEPEVQAPQSSAPVAKKVTPTTAKKDTAVSPVLSKNANNMIYYMMSKNGSLSKANATKIYNSVMKYTKVYGVDPSIVFAVMEQESTFNQYTTYQGAYGLMQLYHTTFPYIGITMDEVYDIDKNIKSGVYELSGNFKMFGDTTLALTAYNWGSGNVKRGNYNTKYANSVLKRRQNILNQMK